MNYECPQCPPPVCEAMMCWKPFMVTDEKADIAFDMEKADIAFDMETADPDDLFTLMFLATSPRVSLRCVTVTPGARDQIWLVKRVLKELGKSIPVGSADPENAEKRCVSNWYHHLYGAPSAVELAEMPFYGPFLMKETFALYPDITLVTGAPLKNLHKYLQLEDVPPLRRWVAQGGFAGDSVVPPEYRLPQFDGRETCPTFNFNGDPKGALLALSSDLIGERRLVSKNVCHGAYYDREWHRRLGCLPKGKGLQMIFDGMEHYLRSNPDGKKFHDPLAACAAIDASVCEWREVSVYREKGEWGSRLTRGSNTFISVRHHPNKFFDLFTEQ